MRITEQGQNRRRGAAGDAKTGAGDLTTGDLVGRGNGQGKSGAVAARPTEGGSQDLDQLDTASCPQCKELHATHNALPEEGGFMEGLSDLIGSVRGIWLLAAIEATYMIVATVFGFDKYPFAFLTLVLSLIALQFSQIIIVVQNRQGALLEAKSAKERQEVAEDFEMDKRAFALLVDLHDKLLPDDDPTAVVDIPAEVHEKRKT